MMIFAMARRFAGFDLMLVIGGRCVHKARWLHRTAVRLIAQKKLGRLHQGGFAAQQFTGGQHVLPVAVAQQGAPGLSFDEEIADFISAHFGRFFTDMVEQAAVASAVIGQEIVNLRTLLGQLGHPVNVKFNAIGVIYDFFAFFHAHKERLFFIARLRFVWPCFISAKSGKSAQLPEENH
jgi:hypothetical protein